MKEKVSVIVPIYNVEKYLIKCIDSIVNQTYKNLEIILVDDGSPDSCPQICDEYAIKDSRIKVIHKENGGLSDARNAGMSVATGEYISFIDSDDYISLDFIETLYNTMKYESSDIVECDVIKIFENKDPKVNEYENNFKVETFDTQDSLSMLIAENQFRQHVWNKLYKSGIALHIPFKKGKLNEDEFWTYQVFGQAKRVTKIKKLMYYYLQRESSIMGNKFNIRRLDALEAKEERQKYIETKFPSLSVQSKIDLFGSCIFACQSVMKFLHGKEKRRAKKIIKVYVNNCKLTKSDIDTVKGKNHFWFSFANKCFMFCCKMRSVTGVGF